MSAIIKGAEDLISEVFHNHALLFDIKENDGKISVTVGFDIILIKVYAGIETTDDYTKLYFTFNDKTYVKWVTTFSIYKLLKLLLLFMKVVIFGSVDAYNELASYALTDEQIKEVYNQQYRKRLDTASKAVEKLTKRMRKYEKIRKRDKKIKARMKQRLKVYEVKLMQI